MESRAVFLKNELEYIYSRLNECYESLRFSRLEDNKKFVKLVELLMEISEKANNLQQAIRVRYFI